MIRFIHLLLLITYVSCGNDEEETFPLHMPSVQPLVEDAYLCTSFRVPRDSNRFITEFLPNATKQRVHHMLIYGCQIPGYYERDTPRVIWDCGEMSASRSSMRKAGPCKGPSQILYAWAMDAPKLALPEGVGFKIGPDTGVDFLVLQVHYATIEPFKNGERDSSGIVLDMLPGDTNKITRRAGVLLLGTGGRIPADSYEHMETTCRIKEPLELHPFAFRTHTHKLGKVVSGWMIRDNTWTLIGKHNPQLPQMFYPVENKSLIIKENDVVAARCTMDNYLDHAVSVGPTGDDEMCNFYMMYYVEGSKILNNQYCFSFGPPFYYWKNDIDLSFSIPSDIDKEASTL